MSDGELSYGSEWSREEVLRTVSDYFDMLQSELLGQPYKKAEHRRRLLPALSGRTGPSVEFKHANISAVLVEMGLPYIDGYQPRSNYQALLATEVETFLDQHPGFFEQMVKAPIISPREMPRMPRGTVLRLFEPPPERVGTPAASGQTWIERRGRKLDFPRRDAENRKLGKLGEKFVVELEKLRLREHGRDDLAGKVEWIAHTCGDGTGYDILSFSERDESERFIEVKTTGLGKFFPFYVSANEVRCSEGCAPKYHLYRVFDFSRSPRVYILQGALSKVCRLDPVQFRAVI
jgi:hypothetical protein